jgi:hypothetical protein
LRESQYLIEISDNFDLISLEVKSFAKGKPDNSGGVKWLF